MSDSPNILPIVTPDSGESLDHFLNRAAEAYHWPNPTRTEDLRILAALLCEAATEENRATIGAHILRALSFGADSSMALRHLDRYLRRFGDDTGRELLALGDNSEHLHFLVSLFSFSRFLSEVVITYPEFLTWIFRFSRLNRDKSIERYREQITEWLEGIEDLEARRVALTRFKKRELLRIGVREIREMAGTNALCRELSNLAEAIIEVAYKDCETPLIEHHGPPRTESYNEICGYCIFAMGKFGAGELNFSSDVDLVFVYDEEGYTDGVPEGIGNAPVRKITNHEFFNKLSRRICQYLNDPNEEGFLFRVDARLRPEGDRGPLARSRPAYAAYLTTQAALWEKIAYQKARYVAGDHVLADVFSQIVELFVYGNNKADEVLPEIARLKQRIDYERLTPEERELDIKRGRGGIREIEFLVQGQQIINGLRDTGIRKRPTLEAMAELVKRDIMPVETAEMLEKAWVLFRRIEHTLQMMLETQTHRMPEDKRERAALALRCGFLKPEAFERTLSEYRDFVRNEFDKIFYLADATEKFSLIDYLIEGDSPPPKILAELKPAGLGDIDGFHALQKLAIGTREFAPSARGQMGFRQLLPYLLEELPHVAMPRQAVHHFDLMLRAARGFTWVYELCLSNPAILKLLLRTLGFGAFLARQLIAHPEWLDELLQSDGLKLKRLERTESALRHRLSCIDDRAEKLLTIRQFKQLESFLIATQEVVAVSSSIEAAAATTRIAEIVLDCIAQLAAEEVFGSRDRVPARWVILGLGGVGDRQVHLTGDLDVAFIAEDDREFEGRRFTLWIDKVGQSIIRHMSATTPEGVLWKIDARLRPEGNNGPLAASRERVYRYYREEAGLWEWQALTKARPIAGDLEFGREVLNDLYDLFAEIGPPPNLAQDVYSMRLRIEQNLRLPRTVLFDMKTSAGGVIMIEFLIQYIQLKHASEARQLFPLSTEDALEEFRNRGYLDEATVRELNEHLKIIRLCQRHLRLLLETAKDHYPADQEKQDALRRGIHDQLLLQGLKFPSKLQSRMTEAAHLYEDFFEKEKA